MSLPTLNLEDRTFDQLRKDAIERARHACPAWTDHSANDPGMVLLELFAYLTEVMIYRLNRLPEKAYVEFLRLIGVALHPPSAAAVKLRFSLARPAEKPVEIPGGTRVTMNRSAAGAAEPPVFATVRTATIAPGSTEVEAIAYHCERVEAEIAGVGTGRPGLSVQARRAPIVARTSSDLELIVGI